MHRRVTNILLTLTLLLFAVSVSAQDAATRDADAAFAAGDSPGALRLYDAVLQANPANVHALVRSAQLLSWAKRYDEAVARYDAALKIEPSNTIAVMERAKILSWIRRYDDSVAGYREMLRIEPGNHEAQLGLARTLSWSNDLNSARREFELLLAKNPNDTDALIGVAQTYAWSGDNASARGWYERALALDATSLGANLGLAYADLGAGKRGAAAKRANELATRYPNDNDVRELTGAIRNAGRPKFELGHEVLEDSDDNKLGISRARVTFPAGRADLSASVARYTMDSGHSDGSVDTAHLQTTIRTSSSTRLTLRGGVDRSKRSNGGESRNTATGTVSFAAGSERRVQFAVFGDRDTFKYSVPILDSGIDVETIGARLSHASNRWILDGGASIADFSDDNRRNAADGVILLRWPTKALSISTGYGYRFLDFDHSTTGGYFDPQDYNAHTFQLRLGRRFASRAEFNLTGEYGLQSFDHRGTTVENDRFAAGAATLTFPLGRVVLLDLSAAKSQSAISAASGFESTQYSIRLRIQQ
jgi:cytochrome c-type biogenesis protein CcmH/NrfG